MQLVAIALLPITFWFCTLGMESTNVTADIYYPRVLHTYMYYPLVPRSHPPL